MDDHLAAMGPLLDVRVQRRVAREIWNAIGGVKQLLFLAALENRAFQICLHGRIFT